MTMLTKIGNSQGVRIPKPIIKQANLENVEIEFEIVKDGLLLKPVKKAVRQNWEESIKDTLSKNKNQKDDGFLDDFLNDNDLEEWEW
ncbi:MAG TPA: AbrB/MazE/SpoVT family DNA-binding domain-containing protein [Campylobacterales bacterium]|jgi:antitoxin MazE|nr:AbrB/MazE/SpoVT family DNA-binding domain-containing protein [Campylobacterales bacterium]